MTTTTEGIEIASEKSAERLLDDYENAVVERSVLDVRITALRARLQDLSRRARKKPQKAACEPEMNAFMAFREKKGLTQGEAAEACGISAQTVGQWERGTSAPRSSTIDELPRGWKAAARELAASA